MGLKKGDRMGIWGPNIYEWVLFQFATAKAGIILVSTYCTAKETFQRLKRDFFI